MADRIASLSDLADTETLRADICIIGSGPGGGIPAVELAKAGIDVLLLEAGPRRGGGGPGQFLAGAQVTGDADFPPVGTVQLGGSSNLWAGRMAPLEPADFEARDWVPHSGWPIGADDLPYERAFRLLAGTGAMSRAEAPRGLPALGGALGPDGLDLKRFFWGPQPFNVADYLDRAIASGHGPRLLFGAPVAHLEEAGEGGRIAAAMVRRPDGRLCRVEAAQFILAAGGIESPRILLSSKGRRGAIGNGQDLVGRYLSTHPKADIATLALSHRVPTDHPLFTDRMEGGGRTRFGLGFGDEAQRRLGLLNHYVQLSPFLEYRANRVFERARMSSAMTSPLIDRSRLARGLLPSLGLFAFEAIGRLAGLQGRARVFILRAFLDQYPNPENRVRLANAASGSVFDIPSAELHWSFSGEDRASVVRFLAALDETLRSHSLGQLDYSSLLAQKEGWPLTGIHSHFMGTTRMGRDEREGVVDRDCRVFGQENLYVSGPSVFTTYGYANPFLTIAALGLRLAGHLEQRFPRTGG
ncbi:FAD-dependent oxidoreductase [Parvibaculum sp.]|uniref:FAD-dependent oxidoreductase n=1 Tax=Parvibaculum sp. TaxID=2024848 RepID=UPI003BAB43A9